MILDMWVPTWVSMLMSIATMTKVAIIVRILIFYHRRHHHRSDGMFVFKERRNHTDVARQRFNNDRASKKEQTSVTRSHCFSKNDTGMETFMSSLKVVAWLPFLVLLIFLFVLLGSIILLSPAIPSLLWSAYFLVSVCVQQLSLPFQPYRN